MGLPIYIAPLTRVPLARSGVGKHSREKTVKLSRKTGNEGVKNPMVHVVICGRDTLKGPKSRMWLSRHCLSTLELDHIRMILYLCVSSRDGLKLIKPLP